MDQTIWKKDIKELEEILEKEGLAIVQNSPDPKDLWILRKSDVVKAAQASFPWQKLVTKWTTPVKLIETLFKTNESLKRKLKGVRKSRKNLIQLYCGASGYTDDLQEELVSCYDTIKDLKHQIKVLKEKISDMDPAIKNPLPRKKKRFTTYGTPMDVENHLIITPEIESSEKVKGDAVDMPEEVENKDLKEEKEDKIITNPLPFNEPRPTVVLRSLDFINKYPNHVTAIFYYPQEFEDLFTSFRDVLKGGLNLGFDYIQNIAKQFCKYNGWHIRQLKGDAICGRRFEKFIILKSNRTKNKDFKAVCKIIVN